MAKLVSIQRAPHFSNAEIKQMLSWLMSVVGDELQPAATRKDACVATLSMAELFDMGENATRRYNGMFVALKNVETRSKVLGRGLENEGTEKRA